MSKEVTKNDNQDLEETKELFKEGIKKIFKATQKVTEKMVEGFREGYAEDVTPQKKSDDDSNIVGKDD
jgi:hypothetical protein